MGWGSRLFITCLRSSFSSAAAALPTLGQSGAAEVRCLCCCCIGVMVSLVPVVPPSSPAPPHCPWSKVTSTCWCDGSCSISKGSDSSTMSVTEPSTRCWLRPRRTLGVLEEDTVLGSGFSQRRTPPLTPERERERVFFVRACPEFTRLQVRGGGASASGHWLAVR